MALWQTLKSGYRAAINSKPTVFWRQWGRFAWMPISAGIDIKYSEDTAPPLFGNIAGIGAALAMRNVRGILPFIVPTVAYAGGRALGYAMIGKSPWARRGETIKARIVDTVLEASTPVNEVQAQDSNTIQGLRHEGVSGVLRKENTEFGSGWTGMTILGLAGGGIGHFFGGKLGGVLGAGIGAGLGFAHHKYMQYLDKSDQGDIAKVIKPGIAAYLFDIVSDIGLVGFARGGVYEKAIRGTAKWIGEKTLGIEKTQRGAELFQRTWKFATGREVVGTAGLMIQPIPDVMSFIQRTVLALAPKSVVENIPPTFKRNAERYLGAGFVLEGLEAAGGLEKISKPAFLKMAGKAAVASLSMGLLGVTFGLLDVGWGRTKEYLRKRNKAPNEFKGHDKGHWGRDQTFQDGDFEPGSSWKGLLSSLERWGSATSRGVQQFKTLRAGWAASNLEKLAQGKALPGFFERLGTLRTHVTSGIMTARIENIALKGLSEYQRLFENIVERLNIPGLTVNIQHVNLGAAGGAWYGGIEKEGYDLLRISRTFGLRKVGLEVINIDKYFQASGLGQYFHGREIEVFRRAGLRTGTTITSPIVNPANAWLTHKMYGGGRFESISGATAGWSHERILQALKEQSIPIGEDFAVEFTGRLPRKAPVRVSYEPLMPENTTGSVRAKMNIGQQIAQAAPFDLHANRRQSHGVKRRPRKR